LKLLVTARIRARGFEHLKFGVAAAARQADYLTRHRSRPFSLPFAVNLREIYRFRV
jgi:hypothetical protein